MSSSRRNRQKTSKTVYPNNLVRISSLQGRRALQASKQWVYTLVYLLVCLMAEREGYGCFSLKVISENVYFHILTISINFLKPYSVLAAMLQDMSDIVGFFSRINADPERGGSKYDSMA